MSEKQNIIGELQREINSLSDKFEIASQAKIEAGWFNIIAVLKLINKIFVFSSEG